MRPGVQLSFAIALGLLTSEFLEGVFAPQNLIVVLAAIAVFGLLLLLMLIYDD